MPDPAEKLVKLTDAQEQALRLVAKRDWPAGEPRLGWLHCGTAARLLKLGLIEKREGWEPNAKLPFKSPIIDLTDLGRAHPAVAKG